MDKDVSLENWLNNEELAITVYNKKYKNGNETFEEFLDRVSGHNEKIKQLILEKKFIFGGRILANRGVIDRKVTYSNCYVLAPPEDNLESIFKTASKMARTFSYGGGVGIDVSNLRPKGAKVSNAAKESTGAVSFMDIYSQVTGTISQAGRRGALMISMDINHPDVTEFIDCKTDLKRINYANISVRVNDEFMKAVENNSDYILHWPCDKIAVAYSPEELEYNKLVKCAYTTNKFSSIAEGTAYVKKIKARELFNKLVKNNWDYAEPGILYWDRIQNYNLLNNTDFRYAGVNPCAEEPLPAGGSCLLGSINLAAFVVNPFTPDARVDKISLKDTVRDAVGALNKVLLEGMQLHPLEEQQKSVNEWRQIGLGTLGMADMLIKLGLTYGEPKALQLLDDLYRLIAINAVEASLELAKKEGCYPKCHCEALVESAFIKNLALAPEIINDIKKYGLFNSQLLTCAPTGTLGVLLNTSAGVEPNFAFSYTRKTQSLNGKDTFHQIDAGIVKEFKATKSGVTELPSYFVSSADISPENRVATQAILQKYIDASISSTCNLPKEATVEDVYNIYMEAWHKGLKGVTIYRSGCKREAVLSTAPIETTELPNTKAPKRPKELEADFYTIKSKGIQYIVLVGLYNGKPYEIFAFEPNIGLNVENHKGIITKKSKMHYSYSSDKLQITELELANDNIEEKAATLYASMLLRHGVDIKYIIKTAKKVNDNISSFSSAMCRVLAKYIPTEETGEKCPECGGKIINEGGCKHCESCSWSKCE